MKIGTSVLVFGGRLAALKAKTECIIISLYRCSGNVSCRENGYTLFTNDWKFERK